jgi:hypothetical protein
MKLCKKCNISKSLELFYKVSNSKDGLNSSCKDCINEKNRLYYRENSNKIIDKKKLYSIDNLDRIKEYQFLYRILNKDKISKYRSENSEYYKNWWKSNRDKASIYDKRYNEKYPHVKICRNTLKSCLERIGLKKDKSLIELLGYSSEDFKLHIESLFTNGMSWENWGDWHVDHKTPVSKFDKKVPVSTINSLDNLQPLWAFDNLSKSNKILND